MNLLAAPFVAIVVPKALPARLVLVALPLAVTLLIREHPHLHRSALPWMVGGALPGTTLGLLIVGHVMSVDLGIAKKSGAWYTYEGEQLGQGRENAKQFLAENVDVMVQISEKVRAAVGLDDATVDLTVDDGDACDVEVEP